MKKFFYFLSTAATLLISANCYPQQVIATAGGNSSGTGVQLSWTIGEPVIETFASSSVILTQGFHQSRLTVTSLERIDFPALELSVYPNPSSDKLHIDIIKGDWKNLNFSLFTPDGKILLQKPSSGKSDILDLESCTSGIYFLKVTTQRGETLQTFKIVKN